MHFPVMMYYPVMGGSYQLENPRFGVPRYYLSSYTHDIRKKSIVGVVSLRLPPNQQKGNIAGYNLNIQNGKAVTPSGNLF